MNLLSELQSWLTSNPPEDMPFWPGARTTGRMGIRTSRAVLDSGGSPLHLGVDRAGGGQFTMPFDGQFQWRRYAEKTVGSVLRLIPTALRMELQIFHTDIDPNAEFLSFNMKTGESLPLRPSNLGLSLGIHTHTEVIFEYDDELIEWLRDEATPILHNGTLNMQFVEAHCARYGMSVSNVVAKCEEQIANWQIGEMTDRFAVREGIPDYRMPHWGNSSTIHVDSMWLLQI